MKHTIAEGAMLVVFGLAASGIVGCAGGPRSKPIPTTEIDKGTGTLQGARKFLEGRWALTSFRPATLYVNVPRLPFARSCAIAEI
jgi:hypothetical protein